MVDVMDTLQRTISIIEKEMAKNLAFLQQDGGSHQKEDANVKNFQRTVLMMRRTTEQITDVSCGITAALVGIDQFLLELGTLTTVEDDHNTADRTAWSLVAKIAVRPKDGKDVQKLIDLPQQEMCDEISNEMKNVSIKFCWKRFQ